MNEILSCLCVHKVGKEKEIIWIVGFLYIWVVILAFINHFN